MVWEIIRHNWLQMRRSLAYQRSVAARVLLGICALLSALYLLVIGVAGGMAAGESDEPWLLLGFMPIVLCFDFFVRLSAQTAAAIRMKHYALLAIPRRTVIDALLVSSFFSVYNVVWACLWLPYTVVAILTGASVGATLLAGLACFCLFLLNTQLIVLCRTLIDRSVWFSLLPLAVCGLLLMPFFIFGFKEKTFEAWLDFFSSPWMLLSALAIPIIYIVNRWLLLRLVYEELASDAVEGGKVRSFAFLDRFGQTGEYLKLELKSVFRNRTVSNTFWSGVGVMLVYSLLISFTPLYSGGSGGSAIWYFYAYLFGALILLGRIMSAEGNYIDLLMTRRENIYRLLCAKYYFNCVLLLLPALVMVYPMLRIGLPLILAVAFYFFSVGFMFFVFFQFAVYQQETVPLNEKLTGRTSHQSSMVILGRCAALICPYLVVTLLIALFELETVGWILFVVGLIFTLLHPVWLKNVYRRMMTRRYANLDGFRETRQQG